MNRIRSYRRIEGITQAEVGSKLGVSGPLISGIERGSREVTIDLTTLGYAKERVTIPSMSTPLHRQLGSTGAKANHQIEELLRLAGEIFADLSARTPRAPRNELEKLGRVNPDELGDAALAVRRMLRIEDSGPIRLLTESVERAGICLFPVTVGPKMSGTSSWVEGQPVIGINPQMPGDRFRLTIAHEIGHLVMHREKSDSTEDEANDFASKLLMSDDDFEAVVPENPTIRQLVPIKKMWGISIAALVYRSHRQGLLDSARYRSLQIQMSKWKRIEPKPLLPTHGTLFPSLVQQHGGLRSAASMLGVNESHLELIVNWAPESGDVIQLSDRRTGTVQGRAASGRGGEVLKLRP